MGLYLVPRYAYFNFKMHFDDGKLISLFQETERMGQSASMIPMCWYGDNSKQFKAMPDLDKAWARLHPSVEEGEKGMQSLWNVSVVFILKGHCAGFSKLT